MFKSDSKLNWLLYYTVNLFWKKVTFGIFGHELKSVRSLLLLSCTHCIEGLKSNQTLMGPQTIEVEVCRI